MLDDFRLLFCVFGIFVRLSSFVVGLILFVGACLGFILLGFGDEF